MIDLHAHCSPARYLAHLEAAGEPVESVARLGAGDSPDEIDARLRLLDEAGVEIQVVSPSGVMPYLRDAADAAEAARVVNDAYAGLAARHPDRLAGFAALPLPDVEAALVEVDRALALPGIVGVTATTSVGDRSIADPTFEPLFAELDRRGAVLFLHPDGSAVGSRQIVEAGLAWSIGAPIEDTVAAVHLVARGIPGRFPRLRIVIPHLGGALPMLLGRLDGQYPRLFPEATELPSLAARRMWYDTVSHGYRPALDAARAAFGADRLVLGTDLPYVRGAGFARAVAYVRPDEPLADSLTAVARSLLRPLPQA